MVVDNILYTPYSAEWPVQWNLSSLDQTTFFMFFSFLTGSALYNLHWGITVGKRYLASSSKLPYDKTPAKSYFLVHQLPTQPYSAACYLRGIYNEACMVGMSRHHFNAFATVLPHYHHTAILSERLSKRTKWLHQHLIKHNEFWLIVEVVRIYPEKRNKIFIIHCIQNVANMHRECSENIRAPNTLPCLSFRYWEVVSTVATIKENKEEGK